MWETQSGKFTTSKKVNIDFFLPEFSAKKDRDMEIPRG